MKNQVDQCQLCDSKNVSIKNITCEVGISKGKTLKFHVCLDCGFHFSPENSHKYSSSDSFAKSSDPNLNKGKNSRAGDGSKPGREYMLAKTGIELYKNANYTLSKPSILIYGSGLSKDHELLRKTEMATEVIVSDIANFQSTEYFIELNDENKKFDIVVCAEVIEHFVDINEGFHNLLTKAKPDGLIICSTNIHDGGNNINRLIYPFLVGHTSYYTGKGLIALASKYGLIIDFRNLDGSQLELGPRKKVVSFFKKASYHNTLNEYFSRHWLFPSEKSK